MLEKLFKRRRCKQCGWELKIFSTSDFCGDRCSSIWTRNGELLLSAMRKTGVNMSEVTKDWTPAPEDFRNKI